MGGIGSYPTSSDSALVGPQDSTYILATPLHALLLLFGVVNGGHPGIS